jgi:signal peptidase I
MTMKISASGSRRLSRPHLRPVALVTTLLTVAVVVLVGFLAREVVTGRVQMRPVLTGSMRPGLPVGGLVIATRVDRASLHERDVIIFHNPDDPNRLVVHRIVKLTQRDGHTLIRTRGDANPTNDPWQASLQGRYAYKARYAVPLLGYPAVYLKRAAVRRDMTIGAGLVLLLVVMSSIVRKPDESSEPESAEPAAASAESSEPQAASAEPAFMERGRQPTADELATHR